MLCASCGLPNVTVGQPCPGCGRVAALPGDASGTDPHAGQNYPGQPNPYAGGAAPTPGGYPQFSAPEPTRVFPIGAAEPTVVFPQAPAFQSAPASTPPRRGKGWVIAVVGVLAVLLIGGGVAFAGFKLGWFGSGKQPYEALPVDSVSYFQIDLNPAADQKLAALNYFRELPQLRNAQISTSLDVKEVLWNEWAKDNDASGLTYATEIKPWLGDRFGVAQLPAIAGDSSPILVIALQVSDQNAAAAKLPTILKDGSTLVTMLNGYAVIAQSTDLDRVKTALASGTMEGNQTFTSDLASLGSTGWVASWVDLQAAAKGNSALPDLPALQGRSTFALRFSGNTLEWAGALVGVDPRLLPVSAGGTDLGNLPADTGFAASLQGGGAALLANWDQLSKSIPADSYLEQQGWVLPDDLAAVLGSQLTLAVPQDTIKAMLEPDFWQSGGYASAAAGARITTDKPQRVQELITKADSGSLVKVRVDGNTVTAATTDEYLARLANNTGDKLANSSVFTAAVPDHAKSVLTVYFDTASLGSDWTSNLSEEASPYGPFLKTLTSVGLSVVPTGSGVSWSLRVARS